MPRVDIRINKPENTQPTFDDIKAGETFWCADGYLSVRTKGNKAVILSDGELWTPSASERVRPVNVAVIEV